VCAGLTPTASTPMGYVRSPDVGVERELVGGVGASEYKHDLPAHFN
jgi:hypothetical protein